LELSPDGVYFIYIHSVGRTAVSITLELGPEVCQRFPYHPPGVFFHFGRYGEYEPIRGRDS
jgi:hypothetical protein